MSQRPVADPEPSRLRQIMVGFGVITLICGGIVLCRVGQMLPGLAGEVCGKIVGVFSTPFLLEGSLFLLGLLAVLAVNHWRRVREGDEFVLLETAEGPGSEALPEGARWAVLDRDAPEGEEPDLLSRAEGAVEVGDHESALEFLARMDDEERDRPEALRLRIRLARATGHDEIAARLQARLDQSMGA